MYNNKYCLLVLFFWIAGCISYATPADNNTYRMPYIADDAIIIVCVRSVARLAYQSSNYWTEQQMIAYCNEIRKSFNEDRQKNRWRAL